MQIAPNNSLKRTVQSLRDWSCRLAHALGRMDTLPRIKKRFVEMPLLPRIFVSASFFVGVAFLLLPLVHGATFNLAGNTMSRPQLWQSGVAVAVMASGALMVVVSVAVFRRLPWVKPLLVVLPLAQVIPFQVTHWLTGAPSPVPSLLSFAVSSIVWGAAVAYFVFATSQGRSYFQLGSSLGTQRPNSSLKRTDQSLRD